nr:MAG TPA: hypothetical protein [Caudoviricetes sp.]
MAIKGRCLMVIKGKFRLLKINNKVLIKNTKLKRKD